MTTFTTRVILLTVFLAFLTTETRKSSCDLRSKAIQPGRYGENIPILSWLLFMSTRLETLLTLIFIQQWPLAPEIFQILVIWKVPSTHDHDDLEIRARPPNWPPVLWKQLADHL